jgi:predicted XRE-type DNA-binding protein
MEKKTSRAKVVQGSGNVFVDLELRNPEERQTKVRLAVEINRIIESGRISQSAASHLLQINQPKISALMNYKLDGFSVERLMNFLTALGADVQIIVRKRPRSRKHGKIQVTAA